MKRSSTKLRIFSYFTPSDRAQLRVVADPVDLAGVDEQKFQQLIDDMLITMRQANGIGLAATQIGERCRLAVIDRSADPSLTDDLILINPQRSDPSIEQEMGEEGCLSIPKVFGMVERPTSITLRAFDRRGRPYRLNASGLLARVIQHETDHLDGILFIDHHPQITKGQKLLP
jgi:peptide deformylase